MRNFKNLLKMTLPLVLAFCIVFSSAATSISVADSTSTTSRSISAQSGNYIYYSVYNEIYRINTSTKEKKLIHQKSDAWDFKNITIHKGYIYCVLNKATGTGEYFPYIYRVKTNGTNGKILAKGDNMYIYKDKIYFSKQSFKYGYMETTKYYGLYRMTLTGKSQTKLSSINPSNIKVYKSYVYFTGEKGTYRISTNGKNYKKLSSEVFDFFQIYSDNIYYNKYNYSYSQTDIYRYNIKTNKSYLVEYAAEGFAVSGGNLYYTNTFYDNNYNGRTYIYKMALSSKKSTYITNKNNVYYITLVGDYFLYTSQGPSEYKNIRMSIIRKDGKYNKVLADYFAS